jgi:hypothetical protein
MLGAEQAHEFLLDVVRVRNRSGALRTQRLENCICLVFGEQSFGSALGRCLLHGFFSLFAKS